MGAQVRALYSYSIVPIQLLMSAGSNYPKPSTLNPKPRLARGRLLPKSRWVSEGFSHRASLNASAPLGETLRFRGWFLNRRRKQDVNYNGIHEIRCPNIEYGPGNDIYHIPKANPYFRRPPYLQVVSRGIIKGLYSPIHC